MPSMEKAFAKLDALLRARAEAGIPALWDAVDATVHLFSPTGMRELFQLTGFDPD